MEAAREGRLEDENGSPSSSSLSLPARSSLRSSLRSATDSSTPDRTGVAAWTAEMPLMDAIRLDRYVPGREGGWAGVVRDDEAEADETALCREDGDDARRVSRYVASVERRPVRALVGGGLEEGGAKGTACCATTRGGRDDDAEPGLATGEDAGLG